MPAGEPAARWVLLEQAVEAIGTALDERRTCEELSAFLHRHLCDAAAVELTHEAADAGAPGVAVRVAADPNGLLEAHRPGTDLSVEAQDEGQPITLSGGPPYAVQVALAHQRHVYGTALALRMRHPFAYDDAAVVHFAARLAAVHIRHAREHTRLHDTAVSLQRALLAEPGQPHPNLDLASRYLPSGGGALVGGDWFETVRLHYGRTPRPHAWPPG